VAKVGGKNTELESEKRSALKNRKLHECPQTRYQLKPLGAQADKSSHEGRLQGAEPIPSFVRTQLCLPSFSMFKSSHFSSFQLCGWPLIFLHVSFH
jgi:hypothetical protein